jgi:uncharacterized protein (DUF1330 family)
MSAEFRKMQIVKNVVLAGISIFVVFGFAGCFSQAQVGKKGTPVYLIAEVTVLNEKLYSEYAAKAKGIVEKYGGRYLVRGGKAVPLEGGWNPQRIIVMEFPSIEEAQAWYTSEEYNAITPLREQSTTSRAILVKGYQPGK